MRRLLAFQHIAAALAVDRGLRRQMLGRRQVELAVQDRIARGIFVHVGGAVADPLPRDEDRQLHVVLDLAHLERRGMAVAHQVADQAGVLGHPPRAAAIRHPRRLHDRRIVAHVVDHPDEAVIQHRNRLEQHRFQRGDGGACGRRPLGAGGVDLGFLLVGQAHRLFQSDVRRRAVSKSASQFQRDRAWPATGHAPSASLTGCRDTAQLTESYRHPGSDRRSFRQDGMKRLTGDAEFLRGSFHGQSQCRQDFLPKQLSWMAGPPGRRPLHSVFRHIRSHTHTIDSPITAFANLCQLFAGPPGPLYGHMNGSWCLTFEWEGEDAIRVVLEQYH